MRIPTNPGLLIRPSLASVALFHACAASAEMPAFIFASHSTPANEVHQLSIFVLVITGGIFVGMSALLIYALVRFRERPGDTTEPPQVFGSVQVELSWTIIPILIIVVLFLITTRVLFSVQDAQKPSTAVDVVVVGHQFWWEFNYPQYGVTTANELHVPLSTPQAPRPTFMKLTSADVMHSFWVPQLAGKTDLLPNRENAMWIDPQQAGLFVGQCAQFCGAQHAKMLLRVYVDTPEAFEQWIRAQQQAQPELNNVGGVKLVSVSLPAKEQAVRTTPLAPAASSALGSQVSDNVNAQTGQLVFEQQACISCHTVKGTVANGRYGPDLTHLMSRATLGAGAAENTPGDLEAWITDPTRFKPGCLMPAMHLTDRQNQQITAYLLTLK